MKVLRTSVRACAVLNGARVVLVGLLVLVAPLAARAATLCVTTGKSKCADNLTFTTIAAAVAHAAVNDTIQVAKGTYPEDVAILKSVSIVGENPKNTIVDATGLSNGFFVDGLDFPGLSNVVISGFTVKNAKYEGILVANASSVTVSNNTLTGNDSSLNVDTLECPGIPAFETAEGFDCGEAIHLLGADHSIVANNLVENNAGGILLSDDTARVHHNFVTGNTVRKNAFDCGITLASHPPAALTNSQTPLGVTENTIDDNLSTMNGLGAPGDGAGVGIFTSVPGAIASGNVVVNNTLTKNGLPGVSMHSHTPGQDMTNNLIIGNMISGNAADTDDSATSGTAGINVFGVSAASGTIISGNTIKDEDLDVVVNTPTSVNVNLNNLVGKGVGVQIPTPSTANVNATQNFWGCAKGPGEKGCTTVSGAAINSTPFSSKKF